jgi:hypothetical protein
MGRDLLDGFTRAGDHVHLRPGQLGAKLAISVTAAQT